MARRVRGGWWLAVAVGAAGGCGGDPGWAPWMFFDAAAADGAVASDVPAMDASGVSDAGARDAADAADAPDARDVTDAADGDGAADVTLTVDVDVSPVGDAAMDAAGSADLGGAPDAPAADRGNPIDAPTDRGNPIDVPADRGIPIDVPLDRGSPQDSGVDVPVDRGSPMDSGVDVPVDRGSPMDTGVDVPVDRGPSDTGVDVPVDRGNGNDTGLPPADPVSYTGSFASRTGRFTATLRVQNEARSVTLVVPTTAGATPPLLMVFHGTNGDGGGVMTESNAQALANSAGVIVVAPSSRWIGHGDWDHATEETYWETAPNTDVNNNQDLLLVRAIMVEAQRAYGVDPTRIYAMGHSNGGFFAQFVAVLLRDRIAAFSTNSGGLVRCGRTTGCSFRGSGSTCAALAARPGYCNCTGPELAVPVPASGRVPPGYLTHGTDDPLVSVYYTCTLADAMATRGHTQVTQLFNGEGHAIPPNWAQLVWPFFASRTLASR